MSTDQHRPVDERAGPAARQAARIGVLCPHGFTSSLVFLGYTAGALRGGGVLRVVPTWPVTARHRKTSSVPAVRTGCGRRNRRWEICSPGIRRCSWSVGHSMIQLAYEMTFTEQIERLTGQLHETEEL
jgi:hypothetical protein